jgi:hypothetical protein
MAFLLILVALLGFVFAGFGSGSSSSGSGTATAPYHITNGPTGIAPLSSKCSKRMHAEPASARCRPPAHP